VTYTAGQDVTVDVFGIEHQGHVVSQSRGWVVCVIATDPIADYGSVGPKLTPRSTVCVPEARVRALT
jgi:hypothetical protein